MKNCILLPVFLLCFVLTVNANYQLSGTISDKESGPIFFATVALYNSADSSLAKANSSDDLGNFVLKNLPEGSYFLKVSFLGYQPFIQAGISLPENDKAKYSIILVPEASDLETVTVIGKVPLLEQKSDRLIVNVENNMTSLNNSLLDVMKKVPGVVVVGDQVRMAGQSNLTILINGKTTRYMDMESLLRDMPGDNIKKIEVIHQPGAEFEASGTGPIINIILKKNSLFGTNGSATLGVGKGRNWKNQAAVSLSHFQGPLNINGSIGYRQSPFVEELIITRNVAGDIFEQAGLDPNFSNTFRANLSLDWDINDKNRIGFASRFVDNRSDNEATNVTNINFLSDSLPDLLLNTVNTSISSWNLFTFNPYYVIEIDTAGQKFEIDANYITFWREGTSRLETQEENLGIFFPNQEYRQPGETYIYTTKADYSLPLSKAILWQLGGKFSFADLSNDIGSFLENEQGEWEENLLQSNRFLFKESIAAAYTKFSYAKDKWGATLGLRYEDSHSEGYSANLDSTLSRDIEQFFPSLSLSRDITKDLGASMAYSYRIDRPRYSSLNPFVYYLDPYTFQAGNPLLSPALTHSTKFNLTYQGQPFFNVEYKVTNDAMVEIIEQNDETQETNQREVNLDEMRNFSTMLLFPLDFIPKISGYGGGIANRLSYYDEDLQGQVFDRSQWSYTAFMGINFTLPWKINTEISGWFQSGGLEGLMESEWLYGTDIGMSKKFLDDKLSINLGAENLFRRFFYADVQFDNMNLSILNKWDSPVFSMRAKYRFGNAFNKGDNRSRSSSASDEMNRAKQE